MTILREKEDFHVEIFGCQDKSDFVLDECHGVFAY